MRKQLAQLGEWLLRKYAPPIEVVPQEVDEPRFKFKRTWTCACGAVLAIKATKDRDEGPSNFVKGMQPSQLNWLGLVEEREWRTDPVTCPACCCGMTLQDYKAASFDTRTMLRTSMEQTR